MPFIKKDDAKTPQPAVGAQKIFVGRVHELHFFIEDILKPADPAYNIISISGDGGVGKSTLLTRIREEAASPAFKSYCMTALVNELQPSPESIMERFAERLRLGGTFKNALTRYKHALRKEQQERDTMQDAVLQNAPDIAGATVEGVPFVGPLLREGTKMVVDQLVKRSLADQSRRDAERLEDPIRDLTKAFVAELNRLAEAQVQIPTTTSKRRRRILLIFDTFEQLAPEIAPWLLDHFLTFDINSTIVLLTAGRIAIERSIPDDPKRWLPYLDNKIITSLSLNSFTEAETREFLAQRGISDVEQMQRIWQLSRGLPLYLSLLTSTPDRDVDPTADVVANFLRWIPEHEELRRRLVLDAALFSRPFNQDDLSAFPAIPEAQQHALYRWLIKQPFVRVSLLDGRYSYHELAEELFSRHLYRSSPETSFATRRALADHYRRYLDELQARGGREAALSPDWLSLIVALLQQMFLLPDEQSHIKAVELVLEAYYQTRQDEELSRVLREMAEDMHYQQTSLNTKHLARVTLNYLEAEPMSSDFLHASASLLTAIAPATTFSGTLLARIYGTRGVTYRNIHDYTRALHDFDRAIELNAAYAWAYGNRGITHRTQHHYDLALKDFDRALQLDNTMDWIYSARAEVHRHLRNYTQALADYDRAIALDPDYAQAYAGLGRLYTRLGQYVAGLSNLDHAIKLDNEQSWFYAQRGEAKRYLRQYDGAIADYSLAIELDPSYFWAYASRGLAWFFQGDYELAIGDYNQALALNPSYDWAYAERGRAFHHSKEYALAIADFDRAISLAPRYAWTYSHRGLSYAALGEYQRAIHDFDAAIAMAPDYGRGYGRRGSVYLALGELERAQRDFARNHELNAHDIWAGWMSEWVALCLWGIDDGTVARLRGIAARNPSHYIALVCGVVAHWLQSWRGEEELPDQVERMLARLEEASVKRPDWWDAYFWQGMIYCAQGSTKGLELLAQAWDAGMPSVLQVPLLWLQTVQPVWYQQQVVPFLENHAAAEQKK